jgi:hypothetical protein
MEKHHSLEVGLMKAGSIRSAIFFLLLSLMMIGLTGCDTLSGRPKRSLDRNRVIRSLEGAEAKQLANLVDAYYIDSVTSATRERIRNEIIDRSIILIDQHYSIFIDKFSGGKKIFDSSADIASMATATASVLLTPVVTKSILAAVSGGITASKASVDKHFLYDQTILILIKQMEAQRRTAVAALISGTSLQIDAYPLSAALTDIEKYYFAGTFDGAMSGIQQNAAMEKRTAEDDIKALRQDIGVRLIQTAARKTVLLKYLETAGNKATLLNAVEAKIKSLEPTNSLRTRFLGMVATAFDAHFGRLPADDKLAAISKNQDFFSNFDNAMKYLKENADSDAIVSAIANFETAAKLTFSTP